MIDVITSIFLLFGGGMMLVSAVGVVRFPDVYTRMHASAKAGTLGVSSLATAVALHFQHFSITVFMVLLIAFFFLTAPIAMHLLGRAAYHSNVPMWDARALDEYHGHGEDPEDQIDRDA